MDAQTKWSETTAAKTRPRLSLKRVALLGLACILVLATAGYGYYWWAVDRFFQSTDDAYVSGDVTPIAPHIAGFIAKIPVADNQLVHAGQLVVRLDDRDVRAAADHAAAVLAQRVEIGARLPDGRLLHVVFGSQTRERCCATAALACWSRAVVRSAFCREP